MTRLQLLPSFSFRVLTLLVCSGILSFSQTARSQVPVEAPPAANVVQPTVTVEMGDRGGKFFGAEPDPAKT